MIQWFIMCINHFIIYLFSEFSQKRFVQKHILQRIYECERKRRESRWQKQLPCWGLERRLSWGTALWCPDFSAAQCWWSSGRGCRSTRHARSSGIYGCEFQISAQKAWWCSTTSLPAARSAEKQQCTTRANGENNALYSSGTLFIFNSVMYIFLQSKAVFHSCVQYYTSPICLLYST